MDEMNNDASDNGSKLTADAAKEAALNLKNDAEKTLGEIKGRGIMGFFSFEHMYFPIIARYIFIVVVVLSLIAIILGVIGGISSIFSVGIIFGLKQAIWAVIGGGLSIIFTRIMFEMFVLGFKVYESLQEIRANTRK